MIQKFLSFLFFVPIIADNIRCVNFYGLETPERRFVCSWVETPAFYLDKMKSLININTVRLPFSYEYVCCSSMVEMDSFVEACQQRNISVILDYHRGYASHQGESPVEQGITKSMWIDSLVYILDRYQHIPQVRAISLFNEFRVNSTVEAELLQREAISTIEEVFPERFDYIVSCVEWGKDCSAMWKTLPNERTLVDVHAYGFQGGIPKLPTSTSNILVGELGWMKNEIPQFEIIKSLLQKRRIRNICLWTLAHSHDTDNLFQDDCKTPNEYIVSGFNSLFEKKHQQYLRGVK